MWNNMRERGQCVNKDFSTPHNRAWNPPPALFSSRTFQSSIYGLMKITSFARGSFAFLLAASFLLMACESTPSKPGEHARNAKEAAKIYVLAGNWAPVNGDGNQLTFVPDTAGPTTGRVIGIFSDAGTYTASEVQPETGRFSMWVNAGRVDSDDPLSRTSFTGEFSADGKLLSLTRHWGGGMPDEAKTYRR